MSASFFYGATTMLVFLNAVFFSTILLKALHRDYAHGD